MKSIVQLTLLLSIAVGCLAQSQAGGVAQQPKANAVGNDTGVVPLVRPYAISTAPHFAVLVQFPKADSIRRIALGDSNYFLAEADKDDPHYCHCETDTSFGRKDKIANRNQHARLHGIRARGQHHAEVRKTSRDGLLG
jgi:hypothetical protein